MNSFYTGKEMNNSLSKEVDKYVCIKAIAPAIFNVKVCKSTLLQALHRYQTKNAIHLRAHLVITNCLKHVPAWQCDDKLREHIFHSSDKS